MTLKIAVLSAAAFFLTGTMHADTITVNLGPSTQNYTLQGTGGSGGFGTYLIEQGTCSAGAANTTCTLSGTYSSTKAGFTSGSYSLVTTYLNTDGGLGATSSTPVDSDGGNYFHFDPFSSDMNMSLLLTGAGGSEIIPMVVDGVFVADSFYVASVSDTSDACSGLPAGVPCTQGNVGLYHGSSLFGPIVGGVIYSALSPVPEPEWLALGGLVPGVFVMLRRRFSRSA